MLTHLRTALRELRHNPRQHGSTLLICTVAAFFGAGMIVGTRLLTAVLGGDDPGSGALGVMLGVTSTVFFGIALFVASLVVVNSFSILVAGRTRTLAMLRLLGASASRLRWGIATEGLVTGVLGAVLGTVLAAVAGLATACTLADRGYGDHLGEVLTGKMLWPGVLVTFMAVAAAWRGARPVLNVSPLEGTRRSVEPTLKTLRRTSRPLLVLSILGVLAGVFLLGLGVLVGLATPLGVLIGFCGGVLSFTGIAVGSAWVMPAFLGAAGWLLRGTAMGRMAVANTRRHPLRAARTSMSLVIGITLIMMFGTVGETLKSTVTSWVEDGLLSEEELPGLLAVTDFVLWFLYAMLAFSLIIAGIGMADNIKAAVMQRTRELGMMRTLGLSVPSLWRMIFAETAQLTIAAALLALPLGVFYGWCGTVSMLASVDHQLRLPAIPWLAAALVVAGCAVITSLAASLPVRQVTRVSPVAALAAD